MREGGRTPVTQRIRRPPSVRVIRGANTPADRRLMEMEGGRRSHLRPRPTSLLLLDVSQPERRPQLHLPLSRKLKLIITVSVAFASVAVVVERRDNGGRGRTKERMLVSGPTACVRAFVRLPPLPRLLLLCLSPPHSDSLAQLFHLDLTAAAAAAEAADGDATSTRTRGRDTHDWTDCLPDRVTGRTRTERRTDGRADGGRPPQCTKSLDIL